MSEQRLKIALIHPSVGCVQGGSEVFAVDLAVKLERYFDVSLICEKKLHACCISLPFINRKKILNSKNPLIRFLYHLLKLKASNPDIALEYLFSIPLLVTHLLFNRYDVLYPHNHWGGLLACSIVRKIKRVPILYTEHNSENSRSYTRHLQFKPDRYIAHTRHFHRWVKTHYPNIHVKFIPNGVNLEKSVGSANMAPLHFSLKQPLVLAVGEFIERKRLDLTIEAVARLPDVNLLMISFGNNLDSLQAFGEKKLGANRFQLLRNIQHEQMPLYYNACDVFTLPSPKESFGLVYLEAMACNKPVVAPDDETRREIISEAGIFCQVYDPDHYAAAIHQALNTEWGNAPLLQAGKYNWNIIAQQYADEIMQMAQ